jgi:hypothetical protein
MRKLIVLAAVLALLLGSAASAAKAAGGDVEYTWTLAALGQGGWLGGPLYEDGSAGGGGAFSSDNGQIVARLRAVSWTEDADENITVCFSATIIKGPADALPSLLCTPPSPVTDTPIKIILFGDLHIFRISETGLEE